MDAAGVISVARTLPIDGALLDDVMLRLRRDSVTPALCWTLGRLGGAEVDARFTSTGPSWTTKARLWNRAGLAVTAATLQLVATGADEVRLTLEPVIPAARARDFQKWELPGSRTGRGRRARRRAPLARDARRAHEPQLTRG